jgi:hypothetical protein
MIWRRCYLEGAIATTDASPRAPSITKPATCTGALTGWRRLAIAKELDPRIPVRRQIIPRNIVGVEVCGS